VFKIFKILLELAYLKQVSKKNGKGEFIKGGIILALMVYFWAGDLLVIKD